MHSFLVKLYFSHQDMQRAKRRLGGRLVKFLSSLWLVQAVADSHSHSLIIAQASLSRRDAIPATMFTCGYLNGDPAQGWPAPSGYDCRVDTAHGIWGFCPTSVITATDCGLGGYCFDTNGCSSGCGSLSNNPAITTWTWYRIPSPATTDDRANKNQHTIGSRVAVLLDGVPDFWC